MDCPATLLRRPIGMQQHDAPENQFASRQDGRTQTRVCGGVVFAPRPDSCTETIPFHSSENHGKVNDRWDCACPPCPAHKKAAPAVTRKPPEQAPCRTWHSGLPATPHCISSPVVLSKLVQIILQFVSIFGNKRKRTLRSSFIIFVYISEIEIPVAVNVNPLGEHP